MSIIGTVYIAGRMRGIPAFNFPAFIRAEEDLLIYGYHTISPARHDLDSGFEPDGMTGNEDLSKVGFDLKDALSWDLQQVLTVDAVVLLPGWERSSGVAAEIAAAKAVGTPVMTLAEALGEPSPAEIGAQTGEVRVTSSTGGAKGSKAARFDLIPTDAMWELAEHFGFGSSKYEPVNGLDNWRNGYPWSLSFAAALRHLYLALAGQDDDAETGHKHVIAVAWHMLTLAHQMNRPEMREMFDDRQDPRTTEPDLPYLQATAIGKAA
jgi:hypothetical protein